MKRSTLTTALLFASLSVVQAEDATISSSPCIGDGSGNAVCHYAKPEELKVANLFIWDTGSNAPTIRIEHTERILRCPDGSLQTGHTESTSEKDYRWVWDDCPKVPMAGTATPTTGCSGFDDCFLRHSTADKKQAVADGDTVRISGESWTITGKITIK
jgi:hypothetical protein